MEKLHFKNTTYYELLGVSREADVEEIKQAYRTLAKKYHPDFKEGDEDLRLLMKEDLTRTRAFKILTFAYHTLTDGKLRAEYDESLGAELPDWNKPSRNSFTDKLEASAGKRKINPGGFGAVQPVSLDSDFEDGGMLRRMRRSLNSQQGTWFSRLMWVLFPPRSRR